jgi:predicted GNAT family acetyltransferase
VEDIADEIDLLPSAGLFLKDKDELVSWIMGHAPMGMSRLFTMDGHRRKGYATLVTLYMSKRMAQSGFLPYVNIVVGNTASAKFFEGLGFRFVCPLNAVLTKPPIETTNRNSDTN